MQPTYTWPLKHVYLHNTQNNTYEMTYHFPKKILGSRISLTYWLLGQTPYYLTSNVELLARLVTGTRRREHITQVLRQLYWLPVRQRIEFKLVATCEVPRTHTRLVDHSFTVAGPRQWNNLPLHVRDSEHSTYFPGVPPPVTEDALVLLGTAPPSDCLLLRAL